MSDVAEALYVIETTGMSGDMPWHSIGGAPFTDIEDAHDWLRKSTKCPEESVRVATYARTKVEVVSSPKGAKSSPIGPGNTQPDSQTPATGSAQALHPPKA